MKSRFWIKFCAGNMPKGIAWDEEETDAFIADVLPTLKAPGSFSLLHSDCAKRPRLQSFSAFTTFIAGGIDDESVAALLIHFLKHTSSKGVLAALRKNDMFSGSEHAIVQERLAEAFRNSTTHQDRRTFLQFFVKKDCKKPSWEDLRTPVADGGFGLEGLGQDMLKGVRQLVSADGFRYGPLPASQSQKANKNAALKPEKQAAIVELCVQSSVESSQAKHSTDLDAPGSIRGLWRR